MLQRWRIKFVGAPSARVKWCLNGRKWFAMNRLRPFLSFMLKPEHLQEVMPLLPADKAALYAPLLAKWCERYEMANPVTLAMFLAQVAEESGQMLRWRENMNYSSPARLVAVWPSRFTLETAKAYVNQPQKLGNYVYGGRLGNVEPMDGWNYRGGGLLQATGREMYAKLAATVGRELGIDFVAEPHRITEPEAGIAAACWIWAVEKGLNEISQAKDKVVIRFRGQRVSLPPFTAVTRLINGGETNLKSRLAYWKTAKRVLGVE